MTDDQFRDLALALDGASEGAHMGHPDFRANGRVFASLHGGGVTGMVALTPEQQAVLVGEHPRMFAPAAGAWGVKGYTTVTLAAATRPVTRGALLLAFQNAVEKPAPKRKPARTRT